MKISDRRCGWTIEGQLLATIPAGERATDDEVLSYYGIDKTDPKAEQYARPNKYDRLVILKDDGNFVIAPRNPDIYLMDEA